MVYLFIILLVLISIYIIGVIYAFSISYLNYTNNLNRVKNSEDKEILMNSINENNKWKVIFKPVWYSWITVYVWYKKNTEVNIES